MLVVVESAALPPAPQASVMSASPRIMSFFMGPPSFRIVVVPMHFM
jgi:hypothetical protein